MELEAFVLASQYLSEVEATELINEAQAEQFRIKFLGTKTS